MYVFAEPGQDIYYLEPKSKYKMIRNEMERKP